MAVFMHTIIDAYKDMQTYTRTPSHSAQYRLTGNNCNRSCCAKINISGTGRMNLFLIMYNVESNEED